ncbi:TPA: hypothetical protein N0F65_005286 [Lagenidium giganteum]|uniref:Cilia- and flagella-associated protein 43 n=1 Tax=Lagenidium giganteum TaxID=4803 RepID=A0AAV2Z0Y3_9STRA|nr:TPA: hypothetical protein N0F65_005286 [Lagenidium giganteum]
MAIDVTTKHVFAYAGTPLQMADEHTMVHVSGNVLQFTSTVTNSQHFLTRARARKLLAFDCNWRTSEIAVTARDMNPEIVIYSYPDKKLRGKLQNGAQYEYTDLKFSRCGKRLLSVRTEDEDEETPDGSASAPSDGSKFVEAKGSKRVCIWDTETCEPLKGCGAGIVAPDIAFISFDPANFDQIVLGGDQGLHLWKIYKGKASYMLRDVPVRMNKLLHQAHSSATSSNNDLLKPGDDTPEPSASNVEALIDLEEKRMQFVCHAWTKNGRLFAANRAGELVLVDSSTDSVVEVVESATRPLRVCIAAIVCTAETILLAYADGEIVWLSEQDYEVLQVATLPCALASPQSYTLGSDLVVSMSPSPNFSKAYVGTRDGNVYEVKTAVLQDDDEEDEALRNGGLLGMPPNGAHLISSIGTFHTGAICASAALTPCGGNFLTDAMVATGGVDGRLYFWSLTKCRLVAETTIAAMFITGAACGAYAGTASGGPDQSVMGTDSGNGNGALNNGGTDRPIVITALTGRAADPVLLIGDQNGKLRALCAAKAVGSGVIELYPLHSVQLMNVGVTLDVLELHPTQPCAIAASTGDNLVFLVSLDHEKRFEVIAYFQIPSDHDHERVFGGTNDRTTKNNGASERVVDVRWSVPLHSTSALSFAVYSSHGLLYTARYAEHTAMRGGGGGEDDTVVAKPLLLRGKLAAHGEELLSKCTSFRFLNASPTSMIIGSSPKTNDMLLIKYPDHVLDPNERIELLSKVLAQEAHENGIGTMALYNRSLRNDEELLATAGLNGTITLWLITFGGVSARETDLQLEDVQAVKKKTAVPHGGPVTTMFFLTVGDDVFLVTTGADGSVFVLDVRITADMRGIGGYDSFNMNALYISIVSFAKYDESFKPGQETTKPFLQTVAEERELAARNRFDRLKDKTRAQLNDLETRLKSMLAENDTLPESERLARDDFVINSEWRDKQLRINRERAERVREGIQRDLAKMGIVRERMKLEFLDSADVKGVKLRGLSAGSPLFVFNFPMRRLSKKELLLSKKIDLLRLVENEHQQFEAKAQSAGASGSSGRSASSTAKEPMEETFATRFADVVPANLQWLIDSGVHHPSLNRWVVADRTKSGLTSSASATGKDGGKDGGNGKDAGGGKDSGDQGASNGQGSTSATATGTSYNDLKSFTLVYHPAAVRTRRQQRMQIQLLRSFERFLLREFNREFDEMNKLKETKMDEIEAKNARMLEICRELGVTATDLFRPKWLPDEVAASILEVQPDEMTQRVYETEEMRKKREKEAAERLELERQRQKDDVAGRALIDMMNGTLETKKENLATQTLVKEQWMIDTPVEEMTAEQKKLLLAFEAAAQKLHEEKEKYKKSLDLELKKIRAEVTDICRAYDDKLRALQDVSVATRTSVLVQQLYELRLAEDLMEHEHLQLELRRLAKRMAELQVAIKKAERESEQFAAQVDACRDDWHRAVDDDKHLEKNFLRELEDITNRAGVPIEHELIKHLVELYKKRKPEDLRDGNDLKKGLSKRLKSTLHLPTGGSSNSGSNNAAGANLMGAAALQKQRLLEGIHSEGSSRQLTPAALLQSMQVSNDNGMESENNYDPFQYVDSRRQDEGGDGNHGGVHRRVTPLDYDTDRPDGLFIDERVWKVLNDLRTKKILAEHVARDKSEQLTMARGVAEELRLTLNELIVSLQEQTQQSAETERQLAALADNSPLLVHIKQGQDETSNEDAFKATADALLVARASVESLNDVIQLHGKDQVGILSKIKNFRKNINIMEWEHTLLQMQTRDMEERYTDIQLLRVTKDLQQLFHTGDTSERQKREVSLLEAKLVHLGQHHQTNLLKIDKTMTKLDRQLKERQRENATFQSQMQQLEMQVQIREDILASRKSAALRNTSNSGSNSHSSSPRGHASQMAGDNPRLRAISVRRKLVDLAKAQTDEIEFLRLELDKMRRRTFPSFAQHIAREYTYSDSKF